MAYDIVVVGNGPAGLSAAVQARARGKKVLVVGGAPSDIQLSKAELVRNYLGMPDCSGAEMMERFRDHAQQMGAELRTGRVLGVMPLGNSFLVSIGSEVEEAGAVVLATGVSYGAKIPGEEGFLGRGVSYCATCDGMFYRNKEVVVVGKSAKAPEEANYLQEIGCRVTYVANGPRPAELREDISYHKAARLEVVGEQTVTALKADGEEIPCAGIFLLRSAASPVDLVPGLAADGPYVQVDRNMATSIPGLFAAGDCVGQPLQISKAVGEGMMAGHRASEFVDQQKKA